MEDQNVGQQQETRLIYAQYYDLTGAVEVVAVDARGQGGANHLYRVSLQDQRQGQFEFVRFQNGPVGEAGVNGVTNEALLAIVNDRLKGFQSGAFACEENATAMDHVQAALMALEKRTATRQERGVEGTNQP